MTSTGQPLASQGRTEMTINDIATLTLMRDSYLTVADAAEDIRGRPVKARDGTEIEVAKAALRSELVPPARAPAPSVDPRR